jgi:aerobic-type carbon monoxide dehydrogenase small subunit (CoxS/CutS family)
MTLECLINGEPQAFEIRADELLLDVLRREGYQGAKRGCGEGTCGACTVLLDGVAVAACITYAAQANGRTILTIEGLGTPSQPHPLQEAFVKHGAAQCGFCIPGMILSAKALLDRHPDPTEAQLREALDGNLCRCTGYVKQLEAIRWAAKKLRGEPAEDPRAAEIPHGPRTDGSDHSPDPHDHHGHVHTQGGRP